MKTILSLTLSSAVLLLMIFSANQAQAAAPLAPGQIAGDSMPGLTGPPKLQGMWVWSSQYINTSQARQDLLKFSKQFGYNRLFIQIHTKNGKIQNAAALRTLIINAAEQGIGVEALDGSRYMGLEKNRAKTLTTLKNVIAFNAALPDNTKLRGMHYDIEPYLLKTWENDTQREKIMRSLLVLYKKAGALLHKNHMTLACDIPFWYDSHDYKLKFDGQTKAFYKHLIDLCGYVGIMSYRHQADKVIKVVKNEMAYAQSVGKYICPSLATLEQKKVPQITFYGRGAKALLKVMHQIKTKLADDPAFGGLLLHDYAGLRHLFAQKR